MNKLGLLCLLGGCAAAPTGSSSPPRERATGPVVPIERTDQAAADAELLRQRLASEKLGGLALVWHDAVLHPTAEAARQASPSPRGEGRRRDGSVRAVHILADEGDVVKVRTWLSPRVRRGMHALTSYDLTLYAARAQLVPALGDPISATFADGSGYFLWQGLPLELAGGPQPLDPMLRALLEELGVRIHPDQVALSFPLQGEDEAPATDPSAELMCSGARLLSAQKVRAARNDDGWGSIPLIEMASCRLASAGDLRLGGRPVQASRDLGQPDACSEGARYRPYRAPEPGRVLVDLRRERGIVRLSAPENALADGDCRSGYGALGMGGLGGIAGRAPEPKKVLAARGKVKVYFPEGALAGYHMSGTTRMIGAKRLGERWCIEHLHTSVLLCFDDGDLVEVPER